MQISRVFSKFSQNCPSPEGTCSYLEDVARDDLQQRFSTQHTISTLLRHCFECLQHCSNIATLCCAKKSSLRIVQCNITLKGRSCVCFDICGGIERASSRGHRAGMQFPQKVCPLCDEKVISSTRGQIGINFTCIFKFFPKMPSSRKNFENKSEIYS